MKYLSKILFRYRSYTPIPFLLTMLLFIESTQTSWLLGIPVMMGGEVLRFLGVSYAGNTTRTTIRLRARYLITNGPFAYVRNPIYLGNLLIYLGFGIISLALFPYLQLFALLFFLGQYHLIINIEEEFLEKKYSNIYLEYTEYVRRFIPRISPYKRNDQDVQVPNYIIALKSEVRTFQALFSVVLASIIVSAVK